MVEQPSELGDRPGGGADFVKVIEHEHKRLCQLRKRCPRGDHEALERSIRRHGHPRQFATRPSSRRDYVGPELPRVGVLRAEREPGGPSSRGPRGHPAREQHGLS